MTISDENKNDLTDTDVLCFCRDLANSLVDLSKNHTIGDFPLALQRSLIEFYRTLKYYMDSDEFYRTMEEKMRNHRDYKPDNNRLII